jgi:tetraacyldisaccharide 4'-kinase
VIRPLAFLVPVYAAALGAKNAAYDRGWLKPRRLEWPAVSVGNLSVGGAGKTPLVIRLAQLLAAAGVTVDVLSRGYGRSGTGLKRVDPEGDGAHFGDEPLLIARAAKVPVYVGANRYEAGLLAERDAPGPGIHLLDDGFQHRRLTRTLDIVVLHASDFEEAMLPAGRLREPLSSLKRASAVVLRADDRHLETELRRRGISAPVWIQHRNLVVESVTRAVAFCGIARPAEFFSGLQGQGVDLAATVALRDHEMYSQREIDRLAAALRNRKAECFITTDKDAARLTRAQWDQLKEAAPLHIARLEVSLEDESEIVRRLLGLIVRK